MQQGEGGHSARCVWRTRAMTAALLLGLASGLVLASVARADDSGESVSPYQNIIESASDYLVDQAQKIAQYRYFYPRVELTPYAYLNLRTSSAGNVAYAYELTNYGHQDELAILQFSLAVDIPAVGCGILHVEPMC